MDERYMRGNDQSDDFGSHYPGDRTRDHIRMTGRSSARDYAAAGEFGRDWRGGRQRERGPYGDRGGYDGREYAGSYWPDGHRTTEYDRDYDRSSANERGFLDRAGDEVRSWFGDEEAERRRDADRRRLREQDDHYGEWRSSRVAEFDRDYDEYRRENAQKFHNEFTSWRTERQGQRDSLGRVSEHMEVLGSDGEHLGTVDKIRGDRVILTKSDGEAGGHHHSIPSRWIATVDEKVTLSKTADQARNHWRDEERSAVSWGGESDRGARNRNFSGTY